MKLTRRNFLSSSTSLVGALAGAQAKGIQNPLGREIIFKASAYGVVGDGVTDNTSALFNLVAAAATISSPTTRVSIYLPAGTVCYLNNRWLYGLLNFDLYGDPSITTIQCLKNLSIAYATAGSIYPFCPWQTNTLEYIGTALFTNTYLFNTAMAGSDTITLTNSRDVSNFVIGQRVLLYGYEEYGPTAFPPHSRFFEWRVITGISGSTLQLDSGLMWSYNDQWADVPLDPGGAGNAGVPRVLLLDQSDTYYPYYAGFHNLLFANNPYHTRTGNLNFCASTLNVQNCTFQGIFNTDISETVNINNCSIPYCELDALCGNITIENTTFGGGPYAINSNGVGGGYQSWRLIFNGCAIYGSIFVSPHNLTITGTSITYDNEGGSYGSISQQPEAMPVSSMTVGGLTLNNSIGGNIAHLEGLETIWTFTVNGVSGNNILLTWPGNWDTAGNNWTVRQIGSGTIIQRNDGAKTGIVQDITFDGTNYIIIIDPSGGVPVEGETWQYKTIQNFTNLGNNVILDGNAFATFGSSPNATFTRP